MRITFCQDISFYFSFSKKSRAMSHNEAMMKEDAEAGILKAVR
jgi:hypothetical protein